MGKQFFDFYEKKPPQEKIKRRRLARSWCAIFFAFPPLPNQRNRKRRIGFLVF